MKTKSRCNFKYWIAPVLCAAFISTLYAGSLWREGVTDERGMFADKRAKRVGDIVTIVVSESVAVTNNESLTTNKVNSDPGNVVGNVVNQFLTAMPATLLGKKLQSAAAKGYIVAPTPAPLTTSGTTSFTGGGQIQNTQTVTAQAAVQVIDVLPNGNLVIEGLREISFSKEKQFASLHGIIRPYDIQSNNTVLSSNVANAQIDIVSEGSLTDSQKKGWLQRLNDKANPF